MSAWYDGLLPQLRVPFRQLVDLAKKYDPSATVTSARRTTTQQAALYRAYLRGENRYPVAPPGRSLHEQGRAIDLVARPEVLRWLGSVWNGSGGTWSPTDEIHFEV